MNAAELQSALDVVVVGHLDGHGRTILWRTPGARDVAAAVRQAAVLPQPLDHEPGWILRRLPDGRLLFLTGGTRHPGLADSFGRSGIFHGAGIVGTVQDIGTALCAPDAGRLCLEAARAAMRGMGGVPSLGSAVAAAGSQGPLQWSGGTDPAPARDWPTARTALRRRGLFDFVGPVGGMLQPVQGPLPPGALEAQRLEGEAVARRIVAAWL